MKDRLRAPLDQWDRGSYRARPSMLEGLLIPSHANRDFLHVQEYYKSILYLLQNNLM